MCIQLVACGDVLALTVLAQLHNVFAVERLSQVIELYGLSALRGLVIRIGRGMDREILIMTEGIDGLLVQEPGMMHGAVVDDLHQRLILIGDGSIVDVDQPVRTAGECDMAAGGVILELSCILAGENEGLNLTSNAAGY